MRWTAAQPYARTACLQTMGVALPWSFCHINMQGAMSPSPPQFSQSRACCYKLGATDTIRMQGCVPINCTLSQQNHRKKGKIRFWGNLAAPSQPSPPSFFPNLQPAAVHPPPPYAASPCRSICSCCKLAPASTICWCTKRCAAAASLSPSSSWSPWGPAAARDACSSPAASTRGWSDSSNRATYDQLKMGILAMPMAKQPQAISTWLLITLTDQLRGYSNSRIRGTASHERDQARGYIYSSTRGNSDHRERSGQQREQQQHQRDSKAQLNSNHSPKSQKGYCKTGKCAGTCERLWLQGGLNTKLRCHINAL